MEPSVKRRSWSDAGFLLIFSQELVALFFVLSRIFCGFRLVGSDGFGSLHAAVATLSAKQYRGRRSLSIQINVHVAALNLITHKHAHSVASPFPFVFEGGFNWLPLPRAGAAPSAPIKALLMRFSYHFLSQHFI